MALVNIQRKSKKPLKLSMTGMEVEFHLLDSKGKISNKSPQLIRKVKSKDPGIGIVKESGLNVIEFDCYPDFKTYGSALDIIRSLEISHDIALANNMHFYPFATYPGTFNTKITNTPHYKMKEKIFGSERYKLSPKTTGFHHHNDLPKGVFDEKTKTIRLLKHSKLMRVMLSSYNFEIAADPALTLFTQSSPLADGQHIAKDMRLLFYRGGRKLKFPDGCFGKLQQLGGLPPYKFTASDLVESFHRRVLRWRRLCKQADPSFDFDKAYPHKLDISWNPVKINKHGTLEQRGMDLNFLSILFSVTVLLKFCLRKIRREFIEVMPADFAIDEPFKLENGILYIPPHTYVRNKLQYWSTYPGYAHKEMRGFIKKFYTFAKSTTPRQYHRIIRPLQDMIDSRQSMSDKILKYAKHKGYLSNDNISDTDAAQLSLHYADQFPKDLIKTKKTLEKFSS